MDKDDVLDLVLAVRVVGSHPEYHHTVMERHREEWPTLWNAIDKVIAAFDADCMGER